MMLKTVLSVFLSVVMMISIVSFASAEDTAVLAGAEASAGVTVPGLPGQGENTPIDLSGLQSSGQVDVGFDFSNVQEEIGALPENHDLNLPAAMPNSKESRSNPRQRSVFNADGLTSFNHISQLTAANPSDFYTFSWSGNNTALINLESSNSNYVVMLCVWNKETGDITTTNAYTFANTPYALQLPPGDYAWYVFSNNGSGGQQYVFRFNGSLPYDTSKCIYVSDDYLYTCSLINGELYRNMVNFSSRESSIYQYIWNRPTTGKDVFNVAVHLNQIKLASVHHIGGFKYNDSESSPVSVNIPDVIVFEVAEGAEWSQLITTSDHSFDPLVILKKNRYDQVGRETPRNLDAIDMSSYDPHLMVYHPASNQWVTFLSMLSWEWRSGGQKSNPVFY